MSWRPGDGGEIATWESRAARKRGVLAAYSEAREGLAAARPATADPVTLRRLRELNLVAAVAFTIGGALFALGAALAQTGVGGPTTSASIYFAGGLFFNTGGYGSLLQTINAPRREDEAASPVPARWRWWSYEPLRIDWVSTFALFAGTLVFGVNLLDSFLQGLSARQVNRLIWAPDMIGCALFLISGHLAFVEICHRRWPCWRRRSLGWWIVTINQTGSVLFLVAALAAYTRLETGSPVNIDISNWGTFAGAVCFCVGGMAQVFERL